MAHRNTTSAVLELFQSCLEPADNSRMLAGEVGGFTWVCLQVVELTGGLGIELGENEGF